MIFDMILFETTTSIIEILWDIALAVFILQIALIYYLAVFLSSCVLNYLRSSGSHLLLPLFTALKVAPATKDIEIAEVSIIALLTVLWARFIIVKYQIPRSVEFRLVVGAVALAFMIGSDLVLGVLAYEEGWEEWRFDRPRSAAWSVTGLLALFALMPVLWLVVEGTGEWGGEKVHRHEGKGVVAAVPTVAVKDKTEPTKKKQ